MHNSALLIFDDGRGLWGPMTDLRPVFDLRTGALTTRQRIERVAARTASALVVPPDQAAAMSPRQSGIAVYAPLSEGRWLAVNGRWPGVAHAQRVQELPVGTALVQGITERDWMVIQNLVLFYGVIFVMVNMAIDFAYAWVDPRIRFQ